MREFTKLIRIMQRLREPGKGCPWDLRQSAESLREYIVEEAYELVAAIDRKDPAEQKDELGDMLLQIVFLARIHEESGHFTIRDVITALTEKLVRRHPHIFAATQVGSAEEVKQNWEKIKMEERGKESILSEYPEAMPALLTANRLAAQAATVGFDWDDAGQALQKVREEVAELESEIRTGGCAGAEREVGDLLFAVANVARLLKVNPEWALNQANRKFVQRFRFIEEKLAERGKALADATLEEMEKLWQQAKSGEEGS